MRELSKMQQKIYEYIAACIREQGYPPSVREIGEAVGLKSPSTVHFHLKRLEEAGVIEKGAGKGRAITLRESPKPENQEMCIRDRYVESHGYSIVREYVGHGVGAQMHESPEIPNYGHPGRGPRLLRGMTLAIEPMVNAGSAAIQQMSDGWTVKTLDGKWAAHYENSILITDGEPEILTAPAI